MSKDVSQIVSKFFDDYPISYLQKGDVLIRPDEELKKVFYLVEGSIIQYDISPAGNEVVVNAFKPGAFFPMSTAINSTPNYYFFEAATPVKLRSAPINRVVTFLKNNPDILFDLLSRVYKGTDGLQRRMAHLMGGNAQSRLIFELLNAAYRFGEKADNGMRVPLGEGDLAKRSGLSRETVSRTMKKLKSQDLAYVEYGSIIISDVNKLEKLLGSEL